MRIASILVGLAAVTMQADLAAAKPGYVPSTLNLRAAPGTGSEIVAKIPGGSLIDVGDCADNWCAVTWQDKKGFSIRSGLDLSGRVPPRRKVVRRHSRGGWVPVEGPVFYEPPPVYVAPPPYHYPYRYRRYWDRPYRGPHYHFRWGFGW